MRTAEEILNEKANYNSWMREFNSYEKECILDVMQEYAQSLAQQALENASENAKMKESEAIGEYNLIYVKVIDKSSITNPDNIPL